jgi:hypothetical protein
VFADGGELTNRGTIIGGASTYATGRGDGAVLVAATASNSGLILGGAGGTSDSPANPAGTGGIGVSLNEGVLTNTGTIGGGAAGAGNGGRGGDGLYLAHGTATNSGLIAGGGTSGAAAYGTTGGTGAVVNSGTLIDTGTIEGGAGGAGSQAAGNGGAGIYLSGGVLTVSGSIIGGAGGYNSSTKTTGATGDAIQFGTLAAKLEIEAGATFQGEVAGNSNATDVLDLTGPAAGTLSGLGSQFTGFSAYAVAAVARWTLAGDNSIASTAALSVAGQLTITGTTMDFGRATLSATANVVNTGTLTFLGPLRNAGTLIAAQGLLTVETITPAGGELAVGATGTLALMAGAPVSQTINFAASGGLLDLADPSAFAGTLTGFGGADHIDLLETAANSLSYAGGVLTVEESGATIARLHVSGAYTTNSFSLGSDGAGGSLIGFT